MKKVTIRSLQNELKCSKNLVSEYARENVKILLEKQKIKKELESKIEILTRQNEFEQKVQNDYIESNKHIREIQAINAKMQQQSSNLSNNLIGAVIDIAGNFLPMIIESMNNSKKETNNNQEPRQK